jgi:hypothetical protein
MRQSHGRLGYAFKIVSSSHSLEQILSAILTFAWTSHELIASLSIDHLQNHIQAMIENKLQPDLSLSERVNQHWNQISEELYDFTIKQQQVELLRDGERVNQERVLNLANEMFRKKCRVIVSLASPSSSSPSNQGGGRERKREKEINHQKVLTALLKKHFSVTDPMMMKSQRGGKKGGKAGGLPNIQLFVHGESMKEIRFIVQHQQEEKEAQEQQQQDKKQEKKNNNKNGGNQKKKK